MFIRHVLMSLALPSLLMMFLSCAGTGCCWQFFFGAIDDVVAANHFFCFFPWVWETRSRIFFRVS
jgi:hypothetical protein